jgi:translation initiation factor IF-3
LKDKNFNYKVNQQITAVEVRVIGPDDKQIGVMKLKAALEKSEEKGLDLVEIAPKAKPPVVRIVELGKFRYEEEKKLKKQKKGVKTSELKEVRFSPFIAEQDYKTRLARVNEFLDAGNKVRAVVKFKGRQMQSKKFGYDLFKKLLDEVNGEINIDMEPKFLGRHLTMVISPIKISKKKTENENETKNEKNTDKKV